MVTKNQTAGQKAAETKAKNKAAAAAPAAASDQPKATNKAPAKVAKASPAPAKAPEKTAPAKTAPKPKVAPAANPEADAEGEEEGEGADSKSVGRKELADTIRSNLAMKGFGVSPKMAAEIVTAFEQSIQSHLAVGENVNLPGFGKFKVALRTGGERRNPRSGDTIVVPDQWAASFKVGKTLKDAVQSRATA